MLCALANDCTVRFWRADDIDSHAGDGTECCFAEVELPTAEDCACKSQLIT